MSLSQGSIKLNISTGASIQHSPRFSQKAPNLDNDSDNSSEEFEPQSYDISSQMRSPSKPAVEIPYEPVEIPSDAEVMQISTSNDFRKESDKREEDNLNFKKKKSKKYDDYEYTVDEEDKEIFDCLNITQFTRQPKWMKMNDEYANEIISKATKQFGYENKLIYPN